MLAQAYSVRNDLLNVQRTWLGMFSRNAGNDWIILAFPCQYIESQYLEDALSRQISAQTPQPCQETLLIVLP